MRHAPSRYPQFVRFWIADAVSCMGTFISGLALQLLLIDTLHADQAALGWVKSAQWLPLLLFGMLAGVVVDRVRRRLLLVSADVCCALLFGAITALALSGQLSVWLLAVLVFAAGTASMVFTAAHQSFLPTLVPAPVLGSASARIEQTWTAAQSAGPAVAGSIVSALSAPFAVLADAVSYAVSAVLLSTVRVDEAPRPGRARPGRARPGDGVLADLKEGARWVYRHPMLMPYAVCLHAWFFCNSVVTTVLVFFAVTDLGLNAVQIGVVLASTGLSGVVGAGFAPRLADRWGPGRVCVLADWLTPAGYLLVVTATAGAGAFAMLIAAQLIVGAGLGLKGPPETTYRTLVTPDRLRGRMNATIRSLNWGSIAVSAPLSGWAATVWGNVPVIWAGTIGLTVTAAALTMSPFRSATYPVSAAAADGAPSPP